MSYSDDPANMLHSRQDDYALNSLADEDNPAFVQVVEDSYDDLFDGSFSASESDENEQSGVDSGAESRREYHKQLSDAQIFDLDQEMTEIYGGNAPVHAFEEYLEIKAEEEEEEQIRRASEVYLPFSTFKQRQEAYTNEKNRGTYVESQVQYNVPVEIIPTNLRHPAESVAASVGGPTDIAKPSQIVISERQSLLPADFVSDWRHKTPAAEDDSTSEVKCRKGSHDGEHHHLLCRSPTPTEDDLERLSFRKIVAELESTHVRQALQDADPGLSRQELFRVCRQALGLTGLSNEEANIGEGVDVNVFMGSPEGTVARSNALGESAHVARIEGLQPSTSQVEAEKKASKTTKGSSEDSRIVSKPSSIRTESRSSSHVPFEDITPIETQGLHPSKIARSPQRYRSRSNSLMAGTRSDPSDEMLIFHPMMSGALREQYDTGAVGDGADFNPQRSNFEAWSPFRKPTTSASSMVHLRSSPLRKALESFDQASVKAVTGSPAPDPADIPSRPDTPRPFTGCQDVGSSAFPGFYLSSSLSNATPMLPNPLLPPCDVSSPSPPPAERLGDLIEAHASPSDPIRASTEQPVAISFQLPWGASRLGPPISFRNKLTSRTVSVAGHKQYVVDDDVHWEEPPLAFDGLSRSPRMAPSPEVLPNPTGYTLRPTKTRSDPFAGGADMISFPPSTGTPPRSPVPDLSGQIYQANRGRRKATNTTPRAKRNATGTHGRAVSAKTAVKARAASSFRKTKATNLGIQGDDTKVTKARSIGRNVSSKKPAKKATDTEPCPRVPSLPTDMDIDLPLPELRRAESPEPQLSIPKTRMARRASKLMTDPSFVIGQSSGTTSAKEHGKDKDIQSTPTRRTQKRAVKRKATPEVAANVGKQSTPRIRGVGDVQAMDIVTPEPAPQPGPQPDSSMTNNQQEPRTPSKSNARVPSKQKTTPSRKSSEAQVEMQAPKTPLRVRKAKPGTPRTEFRDDVARSTQTSPMSDKSVDKNNSTPESAKRRGQIGIESRTPSRRSPRIAKLKADREG